MKEYYERHKNFIAVFCIAVIACTAIYIGELSARQLNATDTSKTAWYSDQGQDTSTSSAVSSMNSNKNTDNEKSTSETYAKGLSEAFHNAAEKVLPSVVMITNMPAAERPAKNGSSDENSRDIPFGLRGSPFGEMFNNPQFRQYFRGIPDMPEMPRHGIAGAGSGVIVDPSGVILTNNHVVAGDGKIMVRLQDGREFKAVDIKTDPSTDLAVLRIEGAGKLPYAKLGNSTSLQVGDWVIALGQPFGLEGSVTAGIISAKGRGLGISNREDFIQTDAAINPGNSGGPLVNLDGEVIGINTAISTSSGGYQGVGFAIPANIAKWVGKQLMETGAVHRAFLGVIIQPVSQPLADQFHVKVHQGVLVTDVKSGTPADKAGLRTGDIVLEYGGKRVAEPRQLQSLVEMTKIGDTEPMMILRDGKQISLNVTCAELPSETSVAENAIETKPGETTQFDKLGIQVEPLTAKVAEQLGLTIDKGLVITDVRSGGPADMAGLSSGMVISEANRRQVNSVDDFKAAIGTKPLAKGLLLLLRTQEGSRFVAIQVENS